MTQSTIITRRAALAGGLASLAAPAFADAPMLGPLRPVANRVKLGAFEVTTILDGAVVFDGPYPIFGGNASEAEVKALAAANGLPTSNMEISFTPTIVNTGSKLVLFDTGNGEGARPGRGWLLENLATAGYKPEDVDTVVITHMHPDHIGGLKEADAYTFPNAEIVTAAAEYDFWSPEARLSGPTERVAKMVQASLVPIADRIRFVQPGDSLAPGIEAVGAFGHTPGHMCWHIESEGQRVMLIADTANHFAIALQRPDWHVRFDIDKAAASAKRKKILGMIAADQIAFVGYHMPFPALGFLEARGEGFHYVPATYQFSAA